MKMNQLQVFMYCIKMNQLHVLIYCITKRINYSVYNINVK